MGDEDPTATARTPNRGGDGTPDRRRGAADRPDDGSSDRNDSRDAGTTDDSATRNDPDATDPRTAGSAALQDALYDVLASRHRRAVLRYLTGRRVAVPVGELATELAAGEAGVPTEVVTADRRRALLVALAHVHLPKLHDVGVVRWDRETDRVAPAPLLAELSVTTPVTGGLLDASVSVRREA